VFFLIDSSKVCSPHFVFSFLRWQEQKTHFGGDLMVLWGRDLYAVVFAVSFLCFGILFFAAWAVSAYIFRRVWPRFVVQEKADWASRVNSQIHAFIVVPGFLTTLGITRYNHSTWYPEDGSNTVAASIIMSISLGYFCFDFLVLVYYRVPLWVVFVFHHVTASVPYFTYLFHPCEAGNIVLSAFLLVEFATIFLNFQTWMEKLGHVRTRWFTWMFYCTYVSWLLTRVFLPVFLLYVVWETLLNTTTTERHMRYCLIPGLVCSHLITLFCWVVFFFVLTPEVLQRWRETPESVESRLLEARLRRRHLLDESRVNSPLGAGRITPTPATQASSHRIHLPNTCTPPSRDSPLPPPSGRSTATLGVETVEFDVDDERQREPIDLIDSSDGEADDVAGGGVADVPLSEGLDYELIVQTMLSDNPYRTRPDHRRELRTLSLEELRREGISMERRMTAYATTMIRL
jgi:hypothetical protein